MVWTFELNGFKIYHVIGSSKCRYLRLLLLPNDESKHGVVSHK